MFGGAIQWETWDGHGIGTGVHTPGTSLGVARAEKVGLGGGTFGGVPVVAGDVLICFTLAGDADLNGKIG